MAPVRLVNDGMHALQQDPRLRHVPGDRWERARIVLARRWMSDVRIERGLVLGTSRGLVGVRVRVDPSTLASRCECNEPQPCEHALALMMAAAVPAQTPPVISQPAVEPPAPTPVAAPSIALPPEVEAPQPRAEPPPAPPADPLLLTLALDLADPGRVKLTSAIAFPDAAAEALRWLWWKRIDGATMSGDARTLAQSMQLLVARGFRVRAGSGGPGRAQFHQRSLGETIHVHLEEPATASSLALAEALAQRGASPSPGSLPAQMWSLPEGAGFASWLLASWNGLAEVVPDLTLNPKPLRGVDVLLDPGCLPARLREAGTVAPVENALLRGVLLRILGGEPVVDAQNAHVLIPATRVVDVEEGLRALGAEVTYRRLAPANARFLQWAPQLPEDLVGARPRLREPFTGTLERDVPGLKSTVALAEYQRVAVAFILHHEHTCLLADDMGLGKTLEAIASAQFLPGRILVVAPASAREVWRREIGKFTGESSVVLGPGADPALLSEPTKYVVTGYSNLEALGDAIRPEAFDLVILDESHYVKNAQSGRARIVRDRLHGVPRRLVISGTPVMNTPEEVRAQLAFLHPDEWSDGAWFRRRFAEPFEEGAPEVRDAVLSRLRQFLEGVMIRREKATALPDLPPKAILWHRVKMPPEARRAYVALEEDFESFVKTEGSASLSSAKAGGKLERLKQAALAGKMPEVVAFVRQLVDGGAKVVVFSRYRNALSSLAEALADASPVTLTGDTAPEERAEAERRFQEDASCKVFLGQLVAAGTALTLTAGSHVVFADLDWNPANHRQAMDRIHRRGQTRACAAHFFLAEETVDEDVAHVLDEKGRMMDALLSGAATGELKGARRLVGERLLNRRSVPTTPTA